MVFDDQDNELNINSLTNLLSITVNRYPTMDNEISNGKYVDDNLDKSSTLRFYQSQQRNLRISVGNSVYKLTKNDRIKIIDVTNIKYRNQGGYLPQDWKIRCNDIVHRGKICNSIKSSKSYTPTESTGALNLPAIGNSFTYIGKSSNNSGSTFTAALKEQTLFKLLILVCIMKDIKLEASTNL